MTWAEDKALRGRNLSADPGVANESGRLPMPPDSFPLICNTNAKNPNVNTQHVSLIQRTVFHFRLNQDKDALVFMKVGRLPAGFEKKNVALVVFFLTGSLYFSIYLPNPSAIIGLRSKIYFFF